MRVFRLAATAAVVFAGALGVDRLAPGGAADDPVAAASALALQAVDAAPAPATAAAPIAPAPVAVEPAVGRLRNDLDGIAARANTGAQIGLMVVSLERGDTLYALNPDVPLAPASNMKLYTTAAALFYLGPQFRFSTYVLGAGELREGVLDGDLILYGTGDPSMSGRMLSGSVSPLRALADTLRARGVREVRGDLVGDGSYFDAQWIGPGWSPDNFGAWYSAPVGALSVGENVASIRITPGAAVGAPAQIATTPATIGFTVINRTTTTAGGATAVRFEYEPGGLAITGRIARGHPGIARSASVVDPTNYTTAVFRRVLQEQGIVVHGGVRTVNTPDQSPVTFAHRAARNGDPQPHPRVLALHRSPPLEELISVTNHVSHNLFAEALLKAIGRVAMGEGSFEAGARAIAYFLECEAGVDSTASAIVDGSGLSPLNRVTARTTIHLLDVMTRNDHWDEFFTSLPEAGRPRPRGLMRMIGTPAVGNLRAKTGTIRNVSSLSGYVRSADGEMLAFSIIGNNLPSSTWAQKRLEDQVGIRLAQFTRGAAADGAGRTIPTDAEARPEADPPPAAPAAQPTRPAAQPRAQEQRQEEPRGGRSYRVRSGDTLDAIARRNNTTVAAIQRANPGLNPNRIRAGDTIRLP